MKNPVHEQIQARKLKARLRMLQHAQRVSGNVSQTCRFFGVSRALFYIWKKRYEKNGLTGLRDQPRRPHHIRYRIRRRCGHPKMPVQNGWPVGQFQPNVNFITDAKATT